MNETLPALLRRNAQQIDVNRDALSLPCSVGLTEEQQAFVIAAVCGLAQSAR